jgi:transposase
MAAWRLTMRRIKEILRLRLDKGLGIRQIARSCKVSHSTVSGLVTKAEQARLTWEQVQHIDESVLEAMFYPQTEEQKAAKRPEPDPEWIHRELRKSKNVTLQLLWEEYKREHPEGLQYSQFCARYRQWRSRLDVPMRQKHVAGEKLFVDFSGEKVPIVDPVTGEKYYAELFIAVLGASNYTYAEACLGQDLHSWINAHCNALEYFGGAPQILVPDNLKSGVKDPDYYEPDSNPTYLEMAQHYDMVIIPTRPYKSRDKAKVENAVLQVQRRIVASLRNRTFTSLVELNAAIAELLKEFNNRPFQKMQGSRRTLFEELDRPALKPLPRERYVLATWKRVKVRNDYHVEVENVYYSVPHQLVHRQVDVRITATTVEILYKGERVASHQRLRREGECSTLSGHRPPSHRAQGEWSPERLIEWGEKIGPSVGAFIKALFESKSHPEEGYRACLGIRKLSKAYPRERLNAACARALAYKAISYKSLESILKSGLDQVDVEEPVNQKAITSHENIRGAGYYTSEGGSSC